MEIIDALCELIGRVILRGMHKLGFEVLQHCSDSTKCLVGYLALGAMTITLLVLYAALNF